MVLIALLKRTWIGRLFDLCCALEFMLMLALEVLGRV